MVLVVVVVAGGVDPKFLRVLVRTQNFLKSKRTASLLFRNDFASKFLNKHFLFKTVGVGSFPIEQNCKLNCARSASLTASERDVISDSPELKAYVGVFRE